MSYQSEREFFIATFNREFPNAPHGMDRLFLRLASGEQRWNEIQCSIEISERETARQERFSTNRVQRAEAMAKSIGAQLIENSDPRGFPLLLKLPSGRTYDWGGRGLGIPGRGLPARCFA